MTDCGTWDEDDEHTESDDDDDDRGDNNDCDDGGGGTRLLQIGGTPPGLRWSAETTNIQKLDGDRVKILYDVINLSQ